MRCGRYDLFTGWAPFPIGGLISDYGLFSRWRDILDDSRVGIDRHLVAEIRVAMRTLFQLVVYVRVGCQVFLRSISGPIAFTSQPPFFPFWPAWFWIRTLALFPLGFFPGGLVGRGVDAAFLALGDLGFKVSYLFTEGDKIIGHIVHFVFGAFRDLGSVDDLQNAF